MKIKKENQPKKTDADFLKSKFEQVEAILKQIIDCIKKLK
jgi:hypothetical protein